ncbi:MAG TPA: DUF2799 domain-containing protein [Rhizobiales bacterium]|nr:DUF2799 domain-containing protein [Hyphomicrobiales bacterium]
MFMRLFLILCLSLLSLVGCASLSEEECQITDWYKLGQGDALEGYPQTRLKDHIKACQRYDISPDIKRYGEGRKAGLQRYCTAENGFRVGRQGYRYQGICPAGTEKAFVGAYDRGSNLHKIELDLAAARQERNGLQKDLRQDETYKNLTKAETSARKLNLSRQIRQLGQEIDKLERKRDREIFRSEQYLLRVAPET